MGVMGSPEKPEEKKEEKKEDKPEEKKEETKEEKKEAPSGATTKETESELPSEELKGVQEAVEPKKEVSQVEEPKREEKAVPEVNASATGGDEPAKSAKQKRRRNKKRAANKAAPAEVIWQRSGGDIRLELRGLKIEAVEEEKGLIILSPKATAAAPPSKPPESGLEVLPPGTEVGGTVRLITRSYVAVDIGQARDAQLDIAEEMKERLRCGEQLALVVEGVDKERNRSVVALAPAAEQEVAGRTPDRTPTSELKVGMEVEGYVQSLSAGIFVDVHSEHNVRVNWKDVAPGSKRPRVGERVRLKVTGVEEETGKVDAAFLT